MKSKNWETYLLPRRQFTWPPPVSLIGYAPVCRVGRSRVQTLGGSTLRVFKQLKTSVLPLFWHLHAKTFRHSSFLRQGRKTKTKGPVSFAADWLLQNINTLLPMKPRGRISWWTTLYRLGGYQLGRMHKPCLHGYSRRDDRIRLRKIMHLIIISIYQISKWQFSLVLIGSRNSECPWLFTVLRPEPRWRLVSRHFWKTKFEG